MRGTPLPERHPGFCSGTRLWLLRHAEVESEWQGRAYGDLNVPLSREGRAATAALAREFEGVAVTAVLSSPLSRARLLGEELARVTGSPLQIESGLREVHRGGWQGRAASELGQADPEGVRAYYADPWGYRGHGGECDEELLARSWPVVERAARAAERAVLALATHYNVIRVVAMHLLGIEPARSFAFRVDPGRCVLFVDGSSGWVLRASNAASPRAVEAAS